MTLAGAKGPLVTHEAQTLIHEATAGSMREIDRVMHNALMMAALRKRKLVEREDVYHVLAGALPSPVAEARG